MSKNHIIVNPAANWGSSRDKFNRAQDILDAYKYPYSIFQTKYPGHAGKIAKKLTEDKADTLIVIGGDGTLNEVLNGIFASSTSHRPALGIIPAGSSNDFSKSLRVPQKIDSACEIIFRKKHKKVDVGQAGSRYFLMASSIGLFADIALAAQRLTGFRGTTRYLLACAQTVIQMRSGWEMSINTDKDSFCGNFGVLLVSNTRRFGGLDLAPEADPEDGFFTCLAIEMMPKTQAMLMIPLAISKKISSHKKVRQFHAAKISVKLGRPSFINNDGEVNPDSTATSIDYRILPKAISIIC